MGWDHRHLLWHKLNTLEFFFTLVKRRLANKGWIEGWRKITSIWILCDVLISKVVITFLSSFSSAIIKLKLFSFHSFSNLEITGNQLTFYLILLEQSYALVTFLVTRKRKKKSAIYFVVYTKDMNDLFLYIFETKIKHF